MTMMTKTSPDSKSRKAFKGMLNMARKSVIKPRQYWPTSDGVQHSSEVAAIEHERMLTIKKVIALDKDVKNTIDKADLPAIINKHFDAMMDASYERGLLPGHYGTREDF
jgi:hypothetical protein